MADSKLEAIRRLAEDSPFEGERAAARAALDRLAARAASGAPGGEGASGPYVAHPWDRYHVPGLSAEDDADFYAREVARAFAAIRIVNVYGNAWDVTVWAGDVMRGGSRGRRSAVGSRAQATRPDLTRQRRP